MSIGKTGHVLVRTSHSRGQPKGQRFQSSKSAMSGGLNLLPQLSLLRARSGRPHWLVIDEAHHLLPASRDDVAQILPHAGPAIVFITVHPEAVSPAALKSVEVVIALGDGADKVIAKFCAIT